MIVFIPSYGRPESLPRMREALDKTNTSCEVVWVLDMDDPSSWDYEWEASDSIIFVESQNLTDCLNQITAFALVQCPDANHIGWIADDCPPVTVNWDKKLRHELYSLEHEKGVGIVYGADGIQNENLPTQFVMSASIVAAQGFFFPPEIKHSYTDNYIKKIGDELGIIKYCPDVQFEHLHPIAGKAQVDETYTKAWSSHDEDMYAYLHHDYEDTYSRIREVMK